MIFSKDHAALILAGKQSANLEPVERAIHPDTVRSLKRRIMRHDADGNELGWETSTVEQGDGDERAPVKITITAVTTIQVEQLTLQQAQWCGHKTVVGCQTAWDTDHPAVLVAQLVRFAVGDLRDRDEYMARAGGSTSVRYLSIDPDAAKVPFDEQQRQLREARKVEAARKVDPVQRERDTIVASIERIEEHLERNPDRAMANTMRALRHQLRSLDRQIKAA